MFNLGQGLAQFFCGLFVSEGFQGTWCCLCLENTLDRLTVVGMVAAGMSNGLIDVITMVCFLLSQDMPGMKAAVFWVLLFKTFQELLTIVTQSHKLIPYRFEAIAYFAGAMDLVGIKLGNRTCRRPFMTNEQGKIG